MQNFPGACPLTPLEARAFGTNNYSLFSITWGWNLWTKYTSASTSASTSPPFPPLFEKKETQGNKLEYLEVSMKLTDHTRLWFLTLPYFVAGIEHEQVFLGVCAEHL